MKKKKEISEDNQPIAFMESTCIVAFNAEKKVKHKHGNRAKPDGRADNYNNNKGGRLPRNHQKIKNARAFHCRVYLFQLRLLL